MSDNYIEGDGAKAIATVLKENMFIVNLVCLCYKSVVAVYVIHSAGDVTVVVVSRIFQTISFERKVRMRCVTCSKPTRP